MRSLEKQLTSIETKLTQVRSKSKQDPINFPVLLDNKLASLADVISMADQAPTQQTYDIFDYIKAKIDRELSEYNNF